MHTPAMSLWRRLTPYVRIARFDHWFKNVFMLPGVVVAVFDSSALWQPDLVWRILAGLLCTGLVASSNYVLNEVLDAPRDALHPVKRHRPVPSGLVNIRLAYGQWLGLGALALLLSWFLGRGFFLSALVLWVMGCLYNIPPVRTKDRVYLDVLSESVNNSLRLLLGWYCTGSTTVPPLSLIMAYWMIGAFFMAIKRFAELRRIGDAEVAAGYRDSFRRYSEASLLLSSVYYAVAFGLFFGIFLARYRLELIVSVPLLAGFIAAYIHLGFKEDSPVQYPERLHGQFWFVAYTLLCVTVMTLLMFWDLPLLKQLFAPTLHHS